MERQEIRQERLTGERALFATRGTDIYDTIFDDGESPLKECADINLSDCIFRWKYPLWYSRGVSAKGCTWQEGARAGMWYSDGIEVENSLIEAPKSFRRSNNIKLSGVRFFDARETLWNCSDIELHDVTARGDYFGMNCEDVRAESFEISGNYVFDGARNVAMINSKLLSKDAFWNCENVMVCDSFITGEYLGWNSKNLTFENCTIESLQGLCYIDTLVMVNCKLINTTLAFEYSTVDADISGKIDSVMNPTSGMIKADSIGELILQKDRIDPAKTKIICRS
ncbi:MAG: DUF3737 family protein [Clostridiales bacterium]|nr:DUF3737 family protein [Clostridiales bacterium]